MNKQHLIYRSKLQQSWDFIHQEKSVPEQSDEGLVTFAQYLRSKLPSGAFLLDVGCGRGRNAIYLSQVGFTVYGCDLSPVAVEVAKMQTQKVGASAAFQVADLTLLPYADNLFKAVVCVHVLPYHLKTDIAKGIREMWRVLRPGGWLYLDLLHYDDAEYGCGRELEAHTFLDPDGIPVHFSKQQEVNELLLGFAVQRMIRHEIGSRPRVAWVVWAVKKNSVSEWSN